jgi:hypothetical protein
MGILLVDLIIHVAFFFFFYIDTIEIQRKHYN